MRLDDNKALARRFFDEVWNQGNLAVIDELTASNFIDHDPMPGQASGIEGVRQFVQKYRSAFPDLHITVEDVIAEGEQVVLRWTAKGTHKGPFFDMPVTGKSATVRGITINRIRNGKFVEGWTSFDQLNMLAQLGLAPMNAPKEQAQRQH
jgi:steroid delta-isomerase-like uncharacterized protein